MKKLIAAALLVSALAAAPCRADGCPGGYCPINCSGSFSWTPFQVKAGFKGYFYLNGAGGSVTYQAGPWYTYWPLEAHFQVPAPTHYPYWPAPMSSSIFPQGQVPPAHAYAAPAVAQPPQPQAVQPTLYRQVGYFPQAAPSYWYPQQ